MMFGAHENQPLVNHWGSNAGDGTKAADKFIAGRGRSGSATAVVSSREQMSAQRPEGSRRTRTEFDQRLGPSAVNEHAGGRGRGP